MITTKLLISIAIFLIAFVWTFRNFKAINDFIVSKTGIGFLSDEIKPKRNKFGDEINNAANTASQPGLQTQNNNPSDSGQA